MTKIDPFEQPKEESASPMSAEDIVWALLDCNPLYEEFIGNSKVHQPDLCTPQMCATVAPGFSLLRSRNP